MPTPNGYIPPRPDFENNYPPVDPERIIHGLPPVEHLHLQPQPSLGDLVQDQHELRTARDLEEREKILRDLLHRRQQAQAKAAGNTALSSLLAEMQSDADMTAQEIVRSGLPPTGAWRITLDNTQDQIPKGRYDLHELLIDKASELHFQRKKIDPVFLAPVRGRGRFVTSHGFSEQLGTLGPDPLDPAFLKHALSRRGRQLHFESPRGIYEAGKAYWPGKTEKPLGRGGEARVLKVRMALARLIAAVQDRDFERAQAPDND